MNTTIIDSESKTTKASPTAGIQEAIDALPPHGGTILLRAGVYSVRQSVLPKPNVTIRGEGAATVLQTPMAFVRPLTRTTEVNPTRIEIADADSLAPGDQMFVYEPPYDDDWTDLNAGYFGRMLVATKIEGQAVRGRSVYGEETRSYRLEKRAVAINCFPVFFLHDADDVTVESLVIDGGMDAPLWVEQYQIEEFMIASILQHNSARVRIQDVTIRRRTTDGICVGGKTSDVMVSGCVVEHCHGIGLHSGGGIRSAQFIGNISRFNQSGFLFCQGNRNVVCANNLIAGNRQHGIWGLGNTDRYCVVTGNNCWENGWHGIEASTSIGNMIQGNVCRNNSKAAPGTYAGIFLDRHRDNIVTGNLCLDDQQPPTQTRGLVELEPVGENIIKDNHCPAFHP